MKKKRRCRFYLYRKWIYFIRRQKLQKDLDKIKEETEMQIAAMEGKIIPKSLKQNDVIIFFLL